MFGSQFGNVTNQTKLVCVEASWEMDGRKFMREMHDSMNNRKIFVYQEQRGIKELCVKILSSTIAR